jgi:hypothetical protein
MEVVMRVPASTLLMMCCCASVGARAEQDVRVLATAKTSTGKTSTMEKERGSSFYPAEKSRVRNN